MCTVATSTYIATTEIHYSARCSVFLFEVSSVDTEDSSNYGVKKEIKETTNPKSRNKSSRAD